MNDVIWAVLLIIGVIAFDVAFMVAVAWYKKPLDRLLDATLGRLFEWAERHGR